jgi:spermidine dehydrogenase
VLRSTKALAAEKRHQSAEEIVRDSRDRELGMHRKITRRDFLNGVAVTAGAAMMPWDLSAAGFEQAAVGPENSPHYYPPALAGMRGSHPGSFEAAHALRDHTFWDSAGKPEDTGETYDLIIVGGSIQRTGGSTSTEPRETIAHVFSKTTTISAYAKRNEFHVGRAFRLGFGGTFSIESPAPYSAVAKAVIEELGIDVSSYPKYFNKNLYPAVGLRAKVFFDKETFGVDKLVVNPSPRGGGESEDAANLSPKLLTQFLAEAPLAGKNAT